MSTSPESVLLAPKDIRNKTEIHDTEFSKLIQQQQQQHQQEQTQTEQQQRQAQPPNTTHTQNTKHKTATKDSIPPKMGNNRERDDLLRWAGCSAVLAPADTKSGSHSSSKIEKRKSKGRKKRGRRSEIAIDRRRQKRSFKRRIARREKRAARNKAETRG